jgi:FAD binding domain in molybdopterin dehydrogenase
MMRTRSCWRAGISLLPMMKLRLAVPSVLIDIGRVAELAGIRVDGDDLVIGAVTCHADVASSELVRAEAPLLAHAAGWWVIRRSGTGGQSAGRWRTPTRPRTCRWRWLRWPVPAAFAGQCMAVSSD